MRRATLLLILSAPLWAQLSPPPSGGGGSATPSGPAGGGLTGTYPNPTVASVPATALPNPAATTLGGVKSLVAVAHNFLTSINTSGVPALAQPGCADLSDAGTGCSTVFGTIQGLNSVGLTGKLQAANLQKFKLALAKTRGGLSDTKILFVGDSITAGNGVSVPANESFYAFPSRVQLGTAYSIQTKPTLGLYPNVADSRFATGAGWSAYGGFGWGSASAYLANGAGGNLVYTAGTQNGTYDTYDVYYLIYGGGGSITATATGGSSSGTISTNGAAAVGKVTVTAAVANATNTVTITNPAGQVFILGIESRLSTAKIIRFANAGVNSTYAAGSGNGAWDQTAYGGGVGGLSMITAYAPDLCFIELGTNDANAGTLTSVYKTAMQTIASTCQSTGDVVFITAPPSSDAPVETLMVGYRAALYQLADSMGAGLIDIWQRWGGVWNTAYMSDPFHPNDYGYWDIGAAVGAFIESVIGPN